MSFSVKVVQTTPFDGQKPGTSGLRKKVVEFQKPNYLENFIQSTFDSLPADELKGCTMVVGGDGRYYNDVASKTIVRMAAANGVAKVVTGVKFLMSTPNVSGEIRRLKAYGGIILTASHNPGGPTEDFGVKYNCGNGGPAPESVTDAIYKGTTTINEYKIAECDVDLDAIDFSKPGTHAYGPLTLVVTNAAAAYMTLMKSIFDFDALKKFVQRPDFSMTYDCMHGVAGPFATEIFVTELGLPSTSCVNAIPKEDFGGGHPDPNLTYAHDLVKAMGLSAEHPVADDNVPEFGAAADGDADRNMILGKGFFVTPSDSVAIIAANYKAIPFFKNGLKGVARSMPTSAALDRVASALKMTCYEVPTGWKFFGNLMDADKLSICGEESFGTGSDHIREKDGAWAVLAWISILEMANRGNTGALVGVEQVVQEHWKTYGRNYYSRYDYENVTKEGADGMMAHLLQKTTEFKKGETKLGDYTIEFADEFSYTDPVDGSVSNKQGMRFVFTDGSRIVFRKSGTGSVGATIRLYVEKYDSANLGLGTAEAVQSLIDIALELSQIEKFTDRKAPTVIT